MSKKKIFIALAATLLISILIREYHSWLLNRSSDTRSERSTHIPDRDSLRCTIYLPSHAGARVGYHYEIMKRFAGSHDLKVKYVPAIDSVPVWELLKNQHTDILVINIIHDPIPKSLAGKVYMTQRITPLGEVWIMMKEHCPWHLSLVHWLTLFKQNPQFKKFTNRFLPSSPDRCPYDSLLRVASKPLGWNWIMLRSVMYQESQYRMNAHSPSDAIGLMQIRRSTAKDMNVKNPFDPEDNIKGAVRYFAFLRRNMQLSHLPGEEEINFVLAAYNAGMGRIQNDREEAAKNGKNPDIWSDVAAYAPKQTQEYVQRVRNRYTGWVSASE